MTAPYANARRLALAAHALLMPAVVALAITQSLWCFVPAALGLVLMLRAQKLACPTCDKPVMRRYLVGRASRFRRFLYKNRGLPERICSECGEALARTA